MGRARVQSHGEKVEHQHTNEAAYSSATSPDKISNYANHSTKKNGLQLCSLGNQVPWVTGAANAERNP